MRRLALVVGVGALALPATATAAPVPVATATAPDGTTGTLLARPGREGVCLTLARVGNRTPFGCLPLPTAEFEADEISAGELDEHTALVVGVARPATKAIDLRFPRPGRRVTIPTVAAPEPWAGKVRFYLGLLRQPAPIYARLIAADGHVRAASDLDPRARPPAHRPRTVARGRLAGGPFRLTLLARSLLEPRPGHPEHRSIEPCLRFVQRRSSDESCGLRPHHRIGLDYFGSCTDGPVVLFGTAPTGTTQVDLESQHGHVRILGTRRLPRWPDLVGLRGFVARVRHADRLRALVARGRHGRRLARLHVHLGGSLSGDGCSGSYFRKGAT